MSIADLDHDLARHAQDHSRGRPEALTDALASVVEPGVLRVLLATILNDEDLLRETAERSFQHPNGFVKIVLLAHAEYQLRLHIWTPGSSGSAWIRENVHSHRWDFSTVLLAGGYRHQEFRVAPQGEEFFSYTYETSRSAGSYSLLPHGVQPLRCVFDAHLSEGTIYTMTGHVLHRVIPNPRRLTVSTVFQGPHQGSTVEVFATRAIDHVADVPRGHLSPESFTRYVSDVLALPDFTDMARSAFLGRPG